VLELCVEVDFRLLAVTDGTVELGMGNLVRSYLRIMYEIVCISKPL
jgi:hypothetical protein